MPRAAFVVAALFTVVTSLSGCLGIKRPPLVCIDPSYSYLRDAQAVAIEAGEPIVAAERQELKGLP